MQNFRQYGIQGNLRLRARLVSAIRRFFETNGYLEVETPVRQPTQAPEVHIDAEPSGEWFLQTSPELCMKRLLSAGFPRIFQICRCFRRRERGDRHLPEMTLLEWYCRDVDYFALMDETERLFQSVAESLGKGRSLVRKDNKIDLSSPWRRISVREAFDLHAPVSLERALSENRFDEIVGFEIEPKLGLEKPVFLYDYPAAMGALARKKPENPQVAERFELYIAGMELANAFSELNDPKEQKERFERELAERKSSGKTVYPMPEKFLASLKQMPNAAGCALGVDRMVMLFADAGRVDDVVAFTPEDL